MIDFINILSYTCQQQIQPIGLGHMAYWCPTNRYYSNGAVTEKHVPEPITESQYKEKYATFDATSNCWYHR